LAIFSRYAYIIGLKQKGHLKNPKAYHDKSFCLSNLKKIPTIFKPILFFLKRSKIS